MTDNSNSNTTNRISTNPDTVAPAAPEVVETPNSGDNTNQETRINMGDVGTTTTSTNQVTIFLSLRNKYLL